jgi:hypothetical protein
MPAVQGFLLHPPWPLIPFLIQPLGFSPSALDLANRPGARFLPTLNAPQARPCPHPPPRSRVPRRSVADLLWRRARRHDWHRSDNPTDGDQWTWHCGFYPGSNPGDATNGTATNFGAARAAFESAWSVFLSERTGADFSGIPALPCIRCLEARDVGPGLQAADPGCGRPLVMLLWHGDWDREHGPAHQRGASGDEMKRAASSWSLATVRPYPD